MWKYFIIFYSIFWMPHFAKGQNLHSERIRELTSTKKSIFLEKGIFHKSGPKISTNLNTIRHSFSKNNGYERMVFDFKGDVVPRMYGYISSKNKKFYIDLFNTTLSENLGDFGDSKFIKAVNFFPVSKTTISLEVIFKDFVKVDIFHLGSPGRLVIDVVN